MAFHHQATCLRCDETFRVCILDETPPTAYTRYEVVCPGCRRVIRFRVTTAVRFQDCDGRLPIAREAEPI